MRHQINEVGIGAAARQLGLSIDTLRYYERIGVIPTAGRRGGRRQFEPGDIKRIGFLLKLRATGMPLEDMIAYVNLGEDAVAARRAILARQAEHLQAVIADAQHCLGVVEAKMARLDAAEKGLPLPEGCIVGKASRKPGPRRPVPERRP